MEDALIAKCPTHDGSEVSLFAIFDGHGGNTWKYLRPINFKILVIKPRKMVVWLHLFQIRKLRRSLQD